MAFFLPWAQQGWAVAARLARALGRRAASVPLMITPKLLRLDRADPVAVALADFGKGEPLGEAGLKAGGDIAQGHKLALEDIAAGAPVRKLGVVIGLASRDIRAGEWVHTHNLTFKALEGARGFQIASPAHAGPASAASFDGYVRDGGRIGTPHPLLGS